MTGPSELNLAQTLQRAFIEAGEPSISSVAAGSGVSRQRLSDWRSGKHVPSRFDDVEPVIAYIRLVADASEPVAMNGDRVTGWTDENWRQAWKRSTTVASSTASRALPQAVVSTEKVDRRPVAIVVVGLLVFLVAALAVAAFLASWAYR
ncbi:hypothetical protein [Tsukamurella ocularis]|uniref:hypothetical protein n=1 Tax=Tsukamurella ocularis TaxID=1970234 RepID=UPI002168A558|nr:hypothetical protein [Tsukamurella ocularis]MCS3779144.1 hypothetical protein [Tsukamurella ocularis]MCS3787236.1 hypothetical protein [Tsukamurella ocularis]MCS3852627.1 hypothetical protein [Tsukamurella ocularis]